MFRYVYICMCRHLCVHMSVVYMYRYIDICLGMCIYVCVGIYVYICL